jgi:hypothetical protein
MIGDKCISLHVDFVVSNEKPTSSNEQSAAVVGTTDAPVVQAGRFANRVVCLFEEADKRVLCLLVSLNCFVVRYLRVTYGSIEFLFRYFDNHFGSTRSHVCGQNWP